MATIFKDVGQWSTKQKIYDRPSPI